MARSDLFLRPSTNGRLSRCLPSTAGSLSICLERVATLTLVDRSGDRPQRGAASWLRSPERGRKGIVAAFARTWVASVILIWWLGLETGHSAAQPTFWQT